MDKENLKILDFLPKETCKYLISNEPAITQAECCDKLLVPQTDYTYCPFCGRHIEREPPVTMQEIM